jgi:hypothetical protein
MLKNKFNYCARKCSELMWIDRRQLGDYIFLVPLDFSGGRVGFILYVTEGLLGHM